MLQVKRISAITLLQADLLERIPGLAHAFSTRRADHAQFTLGPTGAGNPMIELNRAQFAAAAGAAGWPILRLNQTHSSDVCEMRDTTAAGNPVTGDASITTTRGALLAVQTADCVPILIADTEGRAVAAVHAGWRGSASRIVSRVIERLQDSYGIPPADLVAAIGPHNSVCCYEVGADVYEAFSDPGLFEPQPGNGKWRLNLGLANQRQMVAAGIREDRIVSSSLCTQCRPDLFFSYRREGKRAGRLLSVIGLAP
ncbi:MAG TPA: peptidoglycan editing factor PgeF [Terriglobia bacterium]|nr:peptidoglycan editing factor PgeF [Terriglobia bacterium]